MVERLAADVPPVYLEGIVGIEVSPRSVPHPERAAVYTMGECIPLNLGNEPVQSRVVLYHGSFQALAAERHDFDWRAEAWETLTHELRHHLEWRAHAPDLEAYDWAAEQTFARAEGDAFDPVFYLSGEVLAPGVYAVDDEVYLDRVVSRRPAHVEIAWRGRRYRVAVPDASLPLYLILEGLADPPEGDVILVLRRKAGLKDLFRRAGPAERTVTVEPLSEPPGNG